MIGRIGRVLARNPRELVGRAAQEARKRLERTLLPLEPSLLAAAPAAEAMRAFMGGTVPFFAALRRPETLQAVMNGSPEHVRFVLESAARIRDGFVPVLGLGMLQVGAPPRWHREPVSGREAPKIHWSRVPYLDRQIVGDHKILWEFNRHQYFVTLAQAWRFTGDVTWLHTMQEHLRDWLAENPPRLGVNWASSLEIAYRCISWLWALALAGPQALRAFDDQLLADIVRSLQAQGRHVERYLSSWFSPNTHLTGEALGLLYLAESLPVLPESPRWRALARDILKQQLFVQVASDGVYFEQATQYHRYTCDIYLHALALGQAAGAPFSRDVSERVQRAFTVLRTLQRPDGTMALLGDDDGGRLLQLDAEGPHDLNGLLATAAAWFEDPSLLPFGESPVQRLCLLGDRVLPAGGVASPRTAAFPVGGQFVIADPLPAGGHVTLSCGPHGALSCGHSHADELSFELWAGGAPLLVDRGTYAYDGVERDEYRVTASHNTLELGGESVSVPGGAFSWRRRVDATCTGWTVGEHWAWFAGHHDGYVGPTGGGRHQRELWRAANGLWLVEDTVADTGGRDAVVRWHLAPGTKVTPVQSGSPAVWQFDLERVGAGPATLLVLGAMAVTEAASEVSPQYGRRLPARCLAAVARGNRVAVTSVLIDWAALGARRLELQTASGLLLLSQPDLLGAEAQSATGAALPRLIIGGYEGSRLPELPTPLGRVLGFSQAEGAGLVCIGRSVQAGHAGLEGARDTWYAAIREPDDTAQWTHGALSPPR